MTTRIDIVNGPSKFDLMAALFTWKPQRPKVEFKADTGIVYQATINACEAEDGSGECWNIRGQANDSNGRLRINKHFRGFFRTNGRTGFLIFTE